MKKHLGNAYDNKILAEGFFRGGYRYLLSTALYYSGYVKTLESKQRIQGAAPFRILRYERIVDPFSSPYPPLPAAFVTPEVFYKQARYLAKNTNVMPLLELASQLESGRDLPPRTVAITFDGGFREVHDVAAPVLRKFGLPATVFPATAFVDSLNLFWRDKFVAAMLYLEQRGVDFPDIPVVKDALPESFDKRRSLGRSMTRILYLIRYLEKSTAEERLAALTYLGSALEAIGGLPLERQFLSWDELRRLQAQGLAVGFQTHSNRTVEELRREGPNSTAALSEELKQSQALFTANAIKPIPIFAFPEGVVTKDYRSQLAELNIKYGLGIGRYAMLGKINELPVFGRVPINQGTAYSTPLFACRLWNIRFAKEEY